MRHKPNSTLLITLMACTTILTAIALATTIEKNNSQSNEEEESLTEDEHLARLDPAPIADGEITTGLAVSMENKTTGEYLSKEFSPAQLQMLVALAMSENKTLESLIAEIMINEDDLEVRPDEDD